MTQSLSKITHKLVDHYNQMEAYREKAKNIVPSGIDDREAQFNAIRPEYEQFQIEKKNLQNEAEELYVKEPFRTVFQDTCTILRKHQKSLREDVNFYYQGTETISQLNDLFNQYLRATADLEHSDRLKEMDEIKKRNLDILLSYASETRIFALSAKELDTTIRLHNAIKSHQFSAISGYLQELHRLIRLYLNDLQEPTECLVTMKNIFYKELPSCAKGSKVQKQILEQLRDEVLTEWTIDIGTLPEECLGPYESIPVFNDLPRLSKIIEKHPRFNDLTYLRSKILKFISPESDLTTKQCIAEINNARLRLPEKVRWDLDLQIYLLSDDPQKGGDGWGGKNSATNPDLLLKAIDEKLNKS